MRNSAERGLAEILGVDIATRFHSEPHGKTVGSPFRLLSNLCSRAVRLQNT